MNQSPERSLHPKDTPVSGEATGRATETQGGLAIPTSLFPAVLDGAKHLLIMVLDPDGRIVHFNRACEELSGHSVQEAKGRRPWDFLIAPKEIPDTEAEFQQLAAGRPVQSDVHWITKDGRRVLVNWSGSAVQLAGGVVYVVRTGIDVASLEPARHASREYENAVSAIMQAAAQAILAVNESGRIAIANPAAEQMYGYRAGELTGIPLETLMPHRYRDRHTTHFQEWFAQPRRRVMNAGVELSCLRKDGTEFAAEASLSHIEMPAGKLGIAVVSDITERKKNEQVLADYREQLQRLNAGLIAAQETGNREIARELHDVFSQELAAAAMEISSLREEVTSGPLMGRLSALGNKISQVARDIHRTSRELHPAILEELGLEPALRQECERFHQQFAIPTEFTAHNLPPDISEEISLCLYRVTQESLRNIAKHAANADAVRVSLSGNSEGLTLCIEDTGDGFDLGEALKKGGLGLISMDERVRYVGGKLTIQSEPNKGTTITAFVPLG